MFEPPLHSGERGKKKRAKEETDLPSAAALSAARRGKQVAKLLDTFIGRFPILAGGKSLGGGFFGGLSGTSCSGF